MRIRIIFTALLLIGMMSSSARADTVTYSTGSDSIDPSSQTYFWFFNNMQLTFEGKVNKTVQTPSNASLGMFDITGFWGSDTFANVPFNLVIHQIAPPADPSNASFTSVINGTFSFDQSSAWVTFLQPYVQIGDVLYTLTQQTYTLNANDQTSIQANITMTPEPGSLILLGTGLLILAFAFRSAKRSGMILQS